MFQKLKKGLDYLQDQEVDLQIRLLFLLEYATFIASIVGSVAMIIFAQSILMLLPNFALLLTCGLGLYLSHVRKNYSLAANLIIVVCSFICLPIMFFTAGGNLSGMPVWFVFGAVFCCMMSKGKARIITPIITILIGAVSMLLGYYHPDWVIPLKDQGASFFDMLQSFIIVTIMISLSLYVYLATYDRQRKQLEKQRLELEQIMNTDVLTGIANRRAYYHDTEIYKDRSNGQDLVLVAMDLNGLKKVNDQYGHAIGDAFIQRASASICEAFSEYGRVYRMGGDEFMAVLFCSDKTADTLNDLLQDILHKEMRHSPESWISHLSISAGVVVWNRHRALPFSEIEKVADERMYKAKAAYYHKQ